MTKFIDKDYISEKLFDFYDELECIKDHIEDLRWDVENSWLVGESENDECQSSEIGEWKQKVIAALPKKASVKFRNDVEELLEKFDSVY